MNKKSYKTFTQILIGRKYSFIFLLNLWVLCKHLFKCSILLALNCINSFMGIVFKHRDSDGKGIPEIVLAILKKLYLFGRKGREIGSQWFNKFIHEIGIEL